MRLSSLVPDHWPGNETVMIYNKYVVLLHHCHVGVIPKSSNPVHVKENAAIVDFEVTPEDMDLLNCLDKGYHFCWDPTGIA